MIKYLETFNWMGALRGLRNPMRSWNKSDSVEFPEYGGSNYKIGPNDLKLCKQLIKAGASHRKFLRQIVISFDLRANLKFFDEFDTYLHVVKNSTSQMHTITKRDFTIDDFSISDKCLVETIAMFENIVVYLNELRHMYLECNNPSLKKRIWRDMIEIMPQSYLYTRTITMNYEVFLTMYHNRKNHKMDEWVELMKLLREQLPYANEFLNVLENK